MCSSKRLFKLCKSYRNLMIVTIKYKADNGSQLGRLIMILNWISINLRNKSFKRCSFAWLRFRRSHRLFYFLSIDGGDLIDRPFKIRDYVLRLRSFPRTPYKLSSLQEVKHKKRALIIKYIWLRIWIPSKFQQRYCIFIMIWTI